MSGKSYTLKERKGIVDYLIEHKSYKELKGRKMWMDFANSQYTNRTWQSLKETFLKRILPDIHNPYYKLNIEQIESFRQGCDIHAKERNKLEILTIEDSSSNGEMETNLEANTSKATDEAINPGEINNSKNTAHDRASVDTVILDSNPDDALGLDDNIEKGQSSLPLLCENIKHKKSTRDLITYSDPLIPMLREVLQDFDTDEDSQSQIIKNNDDTKSALAKPSEMPDKTNVENTDRVPWRISTACHKSPSLLVPKQSKEKSPVLDDVHKQESSQLTQPKIKSLRLRKKQENSDHIVLPESSNILKNDNKNQNSQPIIDNDNENSEPVVNTENSEKIAKTPVEATQNYSNTTADTVLPNNQEALNNSDEKQTERTTPINQKSTLSVTDSKIANKRASPLAPSTSMPIQINMEEKPKYDQGRMSNTDVDQMKSNTFNSKIDVDQMQSNNLNAIQQQTNINTIKSSEIESNMDTENVQSKPGNEENTPTPASQLNPCLQSVSLYAEQFNLTRYSDTSSDVDGMNKKKIDNKLEKPNKESDTGVKSKQLNVAESTGQEAGQKIVLNSHSKSDSDHTPILKVAPGNKKLSNSQRDKALRNVFGYTNGTATNKRKNNVNHCHWNDSSSGSSEWSSGGEYVNPPQGPSNAKTRKCLKPKSHRIHSLEEDGGLFVICGKKVFPLYKNGMPVRSFPSSNTESDPEEEDNYWKLKYVEARQDVEKLEKLVKQRSVSNVGKTSGLAAHAKRIDQEVHTAEEHNEENFAKKINHVAETSTVATKAQKSVNAKFVVNDRELHLEGHWSVLQPAILEIMDIMHRKPPAPKAPSEDRPISLTSGVSTVDDEVHEKVNRLETEIFKEIEQRAMEEDNVSNVETSSVTIRKRQASRTETRTETPSTSHQTELARQSASPRASHSSTRAKGLQPNIFEEPTQDNQRLNSDNSISPKRKKTPVKVDSNAIPKEGYVPKINSEAPLEEQIMTRSSSRASEKKSALRTRNPVRRYGRDFSDIKLKQYPVAPPKITVSSNSSVHSDTTQGYLDSDFSPPDLKHRRKRKTSLTILHKYKHPRVKRRSYPVIDRDISSDSNSSFKINVRPMSSQSLKSEVNRSESYNLLMVRRNPFSILEKIDEDKPVSVDKDISNPATNDEQINFSKISNGVISPSSVDCGNSSNVSLPLSPELSIVENLSISKELVNSVRNIPTLNETHANKIFDSKPSNQYVISEIDVSMPLMEQICGIRTSLHDTFNPNHTGDGKCDSQVNDWPMQSINTGNVTKSETLSESLDTRLKNLLLESAKKDSDQNKKENNIDVGRTKKARTSKRCSTPRKRTDTKKKNAPKVDTVIEEEHMETCSYGGRRSCPPSIQVISDQHVLDGPAIDDNNLDSAPNVNATGRKKKNVIKVKIMRPKDKKEKTPKKNSNQSKEKTPVKTKECNRLSVPATVDSGINDTMSLGSSHGNDSVDLIHNHSETCLQLHECMGDSVECIETNAPSIISLDSNSSTYMSKADQRHVSVELSDGVVELCDKPIKNGAEITNKVEKSENTCESVYYSPVLSQTSMNSLITDDLSEESSPQAHRRRTWHLLSDDESNSNNVCPQTDAGLFGFANLKQLFPIACAVPDLSTITEASKDTDNSRKPTLSLSNCDSNAVDQDSPHIFD